MPGRVLSWVGVTKRGFLFLSISLGFSAAISFVACGDNNFDSSQVDASPPSDASANIDGDRRVEVDGSPTLPDGGGVDFCSSLPTLHELCESFDNAKLAPIWSVSGACQPPTLDTSESLS